jgi:hypothetical protein
VLKEPQVTPDTVAQLARALGFNAESAQVKQTDLGTLLWEQDELSIEVREKSGALWYTDRSRLFKSGTSRRPTFTDAQAQEMARAFLNRSGLAPTDGTAFVKEVRHLKGLAMNNDGTERDASIIDTEVVFRRNVDGIYVEGEGSTIIVYFDNAGDVAGCYKLWREVDHVHGVVKILSPSSALQEAQRKFSTQMVAGMALDIHDLRFGYYERGPYESQHFLQPTYVVAAEATMEGNLTSHYLQVFPAAATTFEPLEAEPAELPSDQPPIKRTP